jgi:hypothetical protein
MGNCRFLRVFVFICVLLVHVTQSKAIIVLTQTISQSFSYEFADFDTGYTESGSSQPDFSGALFFPPINIQRDGGTVNADTGGFLSASAGGTHNTSIGASVGVFEHTTILLTAPGEQRLVSLGGALSASGFAAPNDNVSVALAVEFLPTQPDDFHGQEIFHTSQTFNGIGAFSISLPVFANALWRTGIAEWHENYYMSISIGHRGPGSSVAEQSLTTPADSASSFADFSYSGNLLTVPEPSTAALGGVGLSLLGVAARFRRRSVGADRGRSRP